MATLSLHDSFLAMTVLVPEGLVLGNKDLPPNFLSLSRPVKQAQALYLDHLFRSPWSPQNYGGIQNLASVCLRLRTMLSFSAHCPILSSANHSKQVTSQSGMEARRLSHLSLLIHLRGKVVINSGSDPRSSHTGGSGSSGSIRCHQVLSALIFTH